MNRGKETDCTPGSSTGGGKKERTGDVRHTRINHKRVKKRV